MQKEPPPFVWAIPDEKNILTCECAYLYHVKHPVELFHQGNYLIVRSLSELPRLLSHSFIFQRGPPDSPFADGEYHGVLIFPPEYPFKPPGIKVGLHHRYL